MVFSSYLFLLYFLPVALAIYYAAPRRAQHLMLTVLSYVFYGWASPLFVVLLLTSTAIDYFAGLYIDRERFRPDESVDELNDRFRRGALELGEAALRSALDRAGWRPDRAGPAWRCSKGRRRTRCRRPARKE